MKYQVPKIQLIPLQDQYVSFQLEGREILGWNSSLQSPRPFFYPLNGPSGKSITRMGHPAAANHGHHRSLWWGHRFIGGVNFWEEKTTPGNHPQIRQETWFHYQSGNENAGFAVQIGWYDSHQVKLMNQELIAMLKPLPKGEVWLELQSRFSPAMAELSIGKTNFGFVGMRLAQTISAQFGGGLLTSSNKDLTEKNIFAKPAKWVDYSGPVSALEWEGATWVEHPDNPRHPTSWHVRDDGWMSPAFCLREGWRLTKADPLVLRYGIHIHAGEVSHERAQGVYDSYAQEKPFRLAKTTGPWPFALVRG